MAVKKTACCMLVFLATGSLTPPRTQAAISGLTRVASGLSNPIFVTYAPGDRSRLFIAERGSGTSTNATATIKILDLNTGTVNATPFLTIPGVNLNGEGGFLGMAFSPNYQTDGKFYVYVTAGPLTTTFTSYVRQYTVSASPDIANTTFNDVLNIVQPPATNHKGGWMGFSPHDGYLYIGFGDGGGSDDNDTGHNATIGNGQDTTVLLGKMLRIDPSGDDFPADATRNYKIPSTNPFAGSSTNAQEIWAYGLRNPFRDSFDRLTGDLWIGDVGQNTREEIDFQPANSPGGVNYGWRLREGFIATPSGGVGGTCGTCTDPVYDYQHVSGSFGGVVVTGGYVYRGPDPSLQGKYFFLDSRNTSASSDDNYWTFSPANPIGTVANINSQLTADTGTHQFPVSFGEDAVGNLYIAYLVSGEVYRIATAHINGDYDNDGDVDADDYAVWRSSFGIANTTGFRPADGSNNGTIDAADYVTWRKNLGTSLGAGTSAVPEPAAIIVLLQSIFLSRMHVRRR